MCCCKARSRSRADGGYAFLVGDHEVAVRPVTVAAHAAAQLVELRESEFIGVIDHDGVDVGNIQAVFDDGRCHQDIQLSADKAGHHLLQLPFRHLPVADADARLGDDALNHGRHAGDGLDAVCARNRPAPRAVIRAGWIPR